MGNASANSNNKVGIGGASTTTRRFHTLAISDRPRKSPLQFISGFVFLFTFLFACVMINTFQLIFVLPLKAFPFSFTERLYDDAIRYTKGSFGALITLTCQLFAPSTLRVTFETEGQGKFTKDEINEIVVRDASGKVIELRLPQKVVLIANHQIYADWWYVWCLTYFMDMHRDVLIVLKKSLKWVPILGWGMQIFRFIFLARSWASDRLYLSAQLSKLGRKAQQQDNPFALIIYPEGTLVSSDTRPVSKKYAEKMGFEDMQHTLLPRSTGLQYSLRSLSPRLPTLKLLDITVAYPGIPPYGYGQSYYTLRSIFMDRVPPPVIHMHLRLFDVTSEVPIGNLTQTEPSKVPLVSPPSPPQNGSSNGTAVHSPTETSSILEVDVPEHEHQRFDEWLRALWREKDAKFEEYHVTGNFGSGEDAVEIPLKLKSGRDVLNAFCFFAPVAFAIGWGWLSRASC